jgi:hypothetical protein
VLADRVEHVGAPPQPSPPRQLRQLGAHPLGQGLERVAPEQRLEPGARLPQQPRQLSTLACPRPPSREARVGSRVTSASASTRARRGARRPGPGASAPTGAHQRLRDPPAHLLLEPALERRAPNFASKALATAKPRTSSATVTKTLREESPGRARSLASSFLRHLPRSPR